MGMAAFNASSETLVTATASRDVFVLIEMPFVFWIAVQSQEKGQKTGMVSVGVGEARKNA
ncbi:MAG: hypothetical protein ABIO38_01450 [Luteimonas sp.]